MKKAMIVAAMSTALLVSVSACGKKPEPAAPADKPAAVEPAPAPAAPDAQPAAAPAPAPAEQPK